MVDDARLFGLETLGIKADRSNGSYALVLTGELDAASCETLERALREAEASESETILLDVDGLRFIDSTGLQAILAAKRRADVDGHRLRITRGTGFVADMFRLTALDRTLPFA